MFTTIQSLGEISPFAGHMVAYETTSPYFGLHKGYTIAENSTTKYGYVEALYIPWTTGEYGPNLTRVLTPRDLHSNCALINSLLLQHPLLLRLATRQEIEWIQKAVDLGEAQLEHSSARDKSQMQEIFTRHLHALLQRSSR